MFEHYYYSLWKRDLLVDSRTNDRFLFDYIYIVSLIIILKQSFCIFKILKISLKSYHVFFFFFAHFMRINTSIYNILSFFIHKNTVKLVQKYYKVFLN